MLATKSLVSIHHHTVDLLYPLCPGPTPFSSGNHYSLSIGLLLLGLAYLFIYIFYIYVKSQGIFLSLPDLLHLA